VRDGRVATQPKPTRCSPERRAAILEQLLAAKRVQLLAHARRHADRDADAEEALQSAYGLFLERYEGGCEPLAWLFTTVKREAWAIRRRASRRREHGFTILREGGGCCDLTETLSDQASDPEEHALRRELHRTRRTAFAGLKPDEHTALLLRGLGYSYREICELTGWTNTKVNRCLAEGRARLRASLGELEDRDRSGRPSDDHSQTAVTS